MAETGDLPQSRLAVPESVDEEAFFTLSDGTPTLAGHADLEAAVPNEEKPDLQELERYWVNEPFAFVVVYRNAAQQESRYYLVEPALSETERALVEFLGDKLKLSIDYETVSADATPTDRAEVVRDETIRLLHRYNILSGDGPGDEREGLGGRVKGWTVSLLRRRAEKQARRDDTVDPVPVERDPETGERRSLTDEQVEKVVYYLVRNFIRYDRIDGLKHDVNVEDISCDGYGEPVFVYHSRYGQLLTNVSFGESELDDFVIKLAQRARKGISKRQPNVDATLADGSRAQLTLGREVSDRGTNFTIRQFREVPFTPVDLVTWETYSLEQMVYLWLAIESGKSMVIAGGTASGKTTTLNALSLFIPSDTKLVSIEDTRELLMPQRNWVANTTRESFREDDGSAIDEFDLLEDALRQRPDYIIMGEVRGEEGRTLFQAMNTGHTVCTTFHANSPKEVIRRFTEEPINVASSMFGAVDLVANQVSTKVDGRRVRRATSIVEIDEYDAEADEFVVDRTYGWDSVSDEVRSNATGTTDLMESVRLDNGWTEREFEREFRQREALLAYLIREGIDTYAGVAASIQAYMHNPEVIMSLVAADELGERIDDLATMRTVDIDVDEEVEALVPRPTPGADLREEVENILDGATDLLEGYSAEGLGVVDADGPDTDASGEVTSNRTATDSAATGSEWFGSARRTTDPEMSGGAGSAESRSVETTDSAGLSDATADSADRSAGARDEGGGFSGRALGDDGTVRGTNREGREHRRSTDPDDSADGQGPGRNGEASDPTGVSSPGWFPGEPDEGENTDPDGGGGQ